MIVITIVRTARRKGKERKKLPLILPFRDVGAIKSVAAYKYKVRLALAPGCNGSCAITFSSLHLNILLSVIVSNVDCIDNSMVSIGTWPLFVIVTVHSAL